jgi:hypothetical protein
VRRGIEVRQQCFRCGHGAFSLGQRGSQLAVIDAEQQVAGADSLVVVNRHLGDVTRDPRCDYGDVATDVGVIGVFR